MANRYRNLIYSTAEYTHSYGSFKGIELNAGALISSRSRLAYSQNMYKDYDGDGADVLESIPGFRAFASYGERVHAIYYRRSLSGGEDHLIVHVKNKLMMHPVSDIHRKNAEGVEIATVEDKKSYGFEYGRFFYVMDTSGILRIDENGECKWVNESGAHPYVPTTYVSGQAYEQRNLLTDSFKEEFYVADPSVYLHATDGLKYTVTDSYMRYCCVSGVDKTVEGEVYIPTYVNIAGTEYKVVSVGEYAFSDNKKIRAVFMPYGLCEIGKRAFCDCINLNTVVTPPTLTLISTFAFAGCSNLTEFYLGAGVENIGDSSFLSVSSLKKINYALTESDFKKINGYGHVPASTVVYNSTYDRIRISLPCHDDIESITGVSVDGVDADFEAYKKKEELVGATLDFESANDVTDTKIIITGKLKGMKDDWATDMTALGDTDPFTAITKCRVAEVFDGRIFFSANPDFPNTVFYTERAKSGEDGALYVGRYNYFNDGVGGYAVTAMLAVRDMLAVFKSGDDGSGSIFYHKKEYTSLNAVDTVYPVAYVHSGICAKGGCLSFLDDPVFLTDEGLMALNSENINYQRNVVCRSHNVNYTLLKHDLSTASMCEWLGYLVIGLGGTVLLADSRAIFTHPAGSREYEWFMLTDIGTYTGYRTVYVYASEPCASAQVHPTKVGKATENKNVIATIAEDGKRYYFVKENGVSYHVLPTKEMSGGDFHPATTFISHGKYLFFATDDGNLCVFNNDMRGVAPQSVRESEDYNEEEYKALMGTKIHPSYYTFHTHAPKYVVKTALDNCGIPHLTKSSVKKSLVIKAKSHVPDAINCEVSCDGQDPVYVGSFPAAAIGFDTFDFDNAPWYVTKYTTVALPENEKRWIEKQITLTSETFACPISLYSISYRYVIKGKIKNNA